MCPLVDDGNIKIVSVTITPTTYKKPFLGGYRHKKNNTEYHHASTQTPLGRQKGEINTSDVLCLVK